MSILGSICQDHIARAVHIILIFSVFVLSAQFVKPRAFAYRKACPVNKLFVTLLLVVAMSKVAHAQSLTLESLSIEQGLSQGFVSDICQDRDGFLWFGTKSGLNRYDGYRFQVFKNDAYDPFSISNNEITSVCEAGEFLVVAMVDRINLFHRRSHKFYRLPSAMGLPPYTRTRCRVENDHSVWVIFFRDTWQVCHIEWPEDLSARLLRDTATIAQVKMERVFNDLPLTGMVISDDGKKLWLSVDPGQILEKNLPDGPLQNIPLPATDLKRFVVVPASGQGFFLGNFEQNQFAWYNPAQSPAQRWRVWRGRQDARMSLLSFDGRHGLFWMISEGMLYGYELDKSFDVLNRANARYALPYSEGSICGFTDQNGIVWIGTDAKGVRKLNLRTQHFQHFLPNNSIYSSLVADGLGYIWMGDLGYGVINRRMSRSDGSLSPFPVSRLALEEPMKVTNADGGSLWLLGLIKASRQEALAHVDPISGREEVFPCPSPLHMPFGQVYYDAVRRVVWVSDWQYLLRFDVASKQFRTFRYEESLDLPQAPTYAMAQTTDGTLWLATEAGLLKVKPRADGQYHFTLLKNNPNDRNSLPSNRLKCLLQDPLDGKVLWIGTAGSGLCRFDTDSGKFQHFNTQNGLPDDVVYGILAENAHQGGGDVNLWISTNKGLARFNPSKTGFRYFLKSDGLQDNEFNTFAYGKTPSGELMFGGVNGLSIFDPQALSSDAPPAAVRFTGFRVNNQLVSPRDASGILSESVEYAPKIALSHRQNNLNISFMSTDMTQPAQNQFRYYLEGAESEWAHAGFEHSAQYLNLRPGSYVFKVVAANSDGKWNDTPTVLRIHIHPPWYATVWAYLIYAFLLLGSVWSVYRYQLRQKLEHAENERLKELDNFKTRFFTNITHEFRTPLTVILGMVERLRHAGMPSVIENAEIIRRNGENLLQLINQILDLSKLEAGKLRLHLEQGDMVAFARYLSDTFHSFAETKQVSLHFLPEMQHLMMDFDREKMQSILTNLLSNAIKFSKQGGDVQLRLAQTTVEGRPFCQITVCDTGIGIAPEKIAHVFERFYQTDDSSLRHGEGSGIGLALTKELVRLMQGDISVSSTVGEGTKFVVLLPISRQSPLATAKMPGAPPIGIAAPPSLVVQAQHSDDADKPLLLVVEDNEDLRQYLAMFASDAYRVIEAHNGQSGIDKALELVPDLIISDVMMPEKDGLQLCQTLKNDPRTSHIPIVLLTAKVSIEDRIAGFARGADAYLPKPFHQEELLLQLRNLHQLRQRLHARYAGAEPPPPTDDPDLQIEDAFLLQFRAYVEANLDNAQLSVEDLCRAVGMGRTNLHCKITSLSGLSAMQYVRAMRMQAAKRLLAEGRLNVSEVAFEVGFDDPKYFGRVFAEETGVPPTQWRKKA